MKFNVDGQAIDMIFAALPSYSQLPDAPPAAGEDVGSRTSRTPSLHSLAETETDVDSDHNDDPSGSNGNGYGYGSTGTGSSSTRLHLHSGGACVLSQSKSILGIEDGVDTINQECNEQQYPQPWDILESNTCLYNLDDMSIRSVNGSRVAERICRLVRDED